MLRGAGEKQSWRAEMPHGESFKLHNEGDSLQLALQLGFD
jgi:hypothetical protein